MSGFTIVNSIEVPVIGPWVESVRFKHKGGIVNENGVRIENLPSDYNGRWFKLIAKHERQYSFFERATRVFKGIITWVCSLVGYQPWSESAGNLFKEQKKVVRFGIEENLYNTTKGKIDNIASKISNSENKGQVDSTSSVVVSQPKDTTSPINEQKDNTTDRNDRSKNAINGDSTSGSTPIVERTVPNIRVTGDSVASLMDRFTSAWNTATKSFDFPKDFDVVRYTQMLASHAQQFKKDGVDYEEHFGFIEKFDLAPSENPRIFVRADLHGDLKSLIENLRSLQEQDLLDENFKCRPGVHIMILGDYCDRGNFGTQILEMLMRLREENPGQVHLIRGNHESLLINRVYGAGDHPLQTLVFDDAASKALNEFYETMSLTTYFSVVKAGEREYVQCTHGLFELTMDPAPLIDGKESGAHIPVPKKRELSERVRKLAEENNSPLAQSAQRVSEMFRECENPSSEGVTVYNWGDVTPHGESWFNSVDDRKYYLNARDVRHYLDISSQDHRVLMLFRGHQHAFQHVIDDEGKVIVTTLPVGMDCPGYQDRFTQPDRAYIITPQPEVSKWEKQALLREKGQDRTDEITEKHLLTSSAI